MGGPFACDVTQFSGMVSQPLAVDNLMVAK
jgi:hypothetical protein